MDPHCEAEATREVEATREIELSPEDDDMAWLEWAEAKEGYIEPHMLGLVFFPMACQANRLVAAQYLYELQGETIYDHDLLTQEFMTACRLGNFKIARWLHSLGRVDIHAEEDDAFMWACCKGHLKIAQWIHSLDDIDIHYDNDKAFYWARNQPEVLRWLRSLP